MKTLRILPFCLAVVAMPLVLTGCNKGGDMSSTPAADTNMAPAPADTNAPAATTTTTSTSTTTAPAMDTNAPMTNAPAATTTNSGT